jgi:hypothetical protein
MGRNPEDIKKELARRSLARKESKAEIEEIAELETEMLTDIDEDLEEAGEYEIVEDFDAIIAMAHEEGYTAYYAGDEMDINPYVMLEEEDADTQNLYVTAWNEGWLDAHTEGCFSEVVITAHKLVTSETEEEANKRFARLGESLTALGEVVDLEELAESWVE